MSEREFIADRELEAVGQDGRHFNIHLRLGKPYQISKDEWACPVSLEGLYKNLTDQHGVDSWQALQLASRLAVELLSNFIQKGGKLFWHEGKEELSLEDLQKFF